MERSETRVETSSQNYRVESTSTTRYICPRCKDFAATNFRSVFRHVRRKHSFEPNFMIKCGIDGCQANYKKMDSWNQHIYRHHRDINLKEITG